jgi:hypothetical protein
MLRTLFLIAMMMHGVGHVLFAANAWGLWKTAQSRALLFSDVLHSPQIVEGAAGLLWLLPLIAFGAATWGLASGAVWWRSTALIAAGLSLLLTVVFWQGINTSSAAFAAMFNVLVIVTALMPESGAWNLP